MATDWAAAFILSGIVDATVSYVKECSVMVVGRLLCVVVCAGVSVISLTGCGSDSGHHVSGTVKFDGKPIPQGMIYFTPDASQKNVGATGYATIKNGIYNTAVNGKPTLGGPMLVKIEGVDPAVKGTPVEGDTSGEVTIKSLFPTYETTASLPKSTAKQDFEVPAEAASRQSAPESGNSTGP